MPIRLDPDPQHWKKVFLCLKTQPHLQALHALDLSLGADQLALGPSMQAADDAVAAAAVDVHLAGLEAGELQETGLQPLLPQLQVGEQVEAEQALVREFKVLNVATTTFKADANAAPVEMLEESGGQEKIVTTAWTGVAVQLLRTTAV
jgi:hypothetical protein